MKGSGFIVQAIIYITFIFFAIGIFIATSIGVAAKTQKIVLEETQLAKAKNLLSVMEKSLIPTWQISLVQMLFAAGNSGFGREYWHKVNPLDKKIISAPPSDSDIKSDMANLLSVDFLPRGFAFPIEANEVGIKFDELRPDFALEDSRITATVSHIVKAFLGIEANPVTEFYKKAEYTSTVQIQFRNLITAASSFVDNLKRFAAPRYSQPAASYIESAVNALRNEFDKVSVSGINRGAFSQSRARLFVPSAAEAGILAPLTGLIFHYDITATFIEDIKPENQYYFYDETSKRFEKKPFPLAIKAEDYLAALNCAQTSGLFTFDKTNDMVCDGSRIYTCNTPIEGIGSNKLTCSGRTGTSGSYGCGDEGFKTSSSVDDSPCYCKAFGGNWITINWLCPESTVSDIPLAGWDCTPFTEDVVVPCPEPSPEDPKKECTETITKYSCTREVPGSCSECTLGSTICSVPSGCRQV